MSDFRVGFIGTGRRKERADTTGFFMAYTHADGYRGAGGCELVACCDIVQENAQGFAAYYGIDKVYLDYREMLAKEQLDVVSICTWPHLHEPMVTDCCAAGVRAVHCEKPMADTWGGAQRMARAAVEASTQLTFNHQLRYGWHSDAALQAITDGAIGQVLRFDACRGVLLDVGTHVLDQINMINGDQRAKWVLAQIDYRDENLYFGAHCENQHILFLEYANGAHGLLMTTPDGRNPVGALIRRHDETEWTVPTAPEGGSLAPMDRCLGDVMDCVRTGRKCRVDASNALLATEIIFATFESSRRRGRVDLPLDVTDNALRSMVDSGALTPRRKAS
ncbi:MAG: Gfo/Idh/MocA family oxidoreductase [Armatimonadetes bacterium]|nr:Gfo/Idh/MocA family oxidoreductase [Armatimonadota bacterium]